jgi:ATP-binding cassette subfamily A (ABC1) protein 3
MKEGSLQCCGSNLFLKQKFGLGYNLTLVTENDSHKISQLQQNNITENNNGSIPSTSDKKRSPDII